MTNAEKVLDEIHKFPGRKAWQIGKSLGLTRKQVNSIIYGQLTGKVRQDSGFKWWPKQPKCESIPTPDTRPTPLPTAEKQTSEFAILRPILRPNSVAKPRPVPPQPAKLPTPKQSEKKKSGYAVFWIICALLIGGLVYAGNSSKSSNYSTPASSSRTGYDGLPKPSYGGVPVRGYYRSNGTYVQPHYRSAPDGIKSNNWSYKGNTNPYTGKRGSHR